MNTFRAAATVILASCIILGPVKAEDLFVRANHNSGANTGADWTNAWNGFSAIVWGDGPGKLGAGDTCWIAGGTYATPLVIGVSGTAGAPLLLQRVRATDAIATTVAGWDSAFDSTVVIVGPTANAGILFKDGVGSFVTIDGRIASGIRVDYPDASNGVEIDGAVAFSDVTLRYIEAAGPGPIVQTGSTRGFDLTIPAMLTNLTLSHCSAHHSDTLLQVTDSTNLVIEYCDFHDAGAVNASAYHPNAVYLGTVHNAVFRYNKVHEIDVEGLFFGDSGNVGAKIHGNVFYQGKTAPNSGRGIEFDDTADSTDFLIHNNTFVDLPLPGVNFRNGRAHPGASVQNNIFSGCSVEFGPAEHDYNFVNTVASVEPHGIKGSSAIFANAAQFDYHLTGRLGDDQPRNHGVALPSPFNIDADGIARGAADGAWDIGAFELVNTAPALSAIADVTTLSGAVAGPLAFTISDAETSPAALSLSVATDNAALLPLAAITITGTGTDRTISVQPSAGATGRAVVTLLVDDGMGLSRSTAFAVTVLSAALPNQAVTVGRTVTLSAPAGLADVQWQVSRDGGATYTNLADGTDVSGATTRLLTLSNVAATQPAARYRFVTRTTAGTANSAAATLTVSPLLFPYPNGIASDSAGNLFVTDTSTNTVKKISPTGEVTLVAGQSGQTGFADGTVTAARFNQPAGLVVLADGSLVVADSANGTIRRVSSAGVVTTLAGNPLLRGSADGVGRDATFTFPVGIVSDSSGNFLITDALSHTLRKVTASGNVTTILGTAGLSGTVDGQGNAARFNSPTGLSRDGSDTFFVSDTTNNTIRKFTSTGLVTTLAGLAEVAGNTDGIGDAALFNRPLGLATDRAGNLFVADSGNSTVRKIAAANGAVTTFAGLPGIAGLKDGIGGDAFFNQPRSLTIDASDNLYVADTGNAAIRRVSPDGTVTTLALTEGPAPSVPDTPAPPPPPPTTPDPKTPSPSSGGGGGGALSAWTSILFGVLPVLRALSRSLKIRTQISSAKPSTPRSHP